MDFIVENYLIIILVGLFFVFALIGYLVDMLRNSKEQEKEEIPVNIKPVELKDLTDNDTDEVIETPKEIEDTTQEVSVDNEDDLLKNYDESISE